MRYWVALLNHSPNEIDEYVRSLSWLFDEVNVIRLRQHTTGYATLFQIDFRLQAPQRHSEIRVEPTFDRVAYSGWMRDVRADRVYSASLNDFLPVDPTRQLTTGEFSYAAVQPSCSILATDHYATHPVYYHQGTDGQWIASNDLRLILLSDGVPLEIRNDACYEFLSPTNAVGENELANGMTFFRGLLRLQPNSALTISRNGLSHRIKPCFSVDENFQLPRGITKADAYCEAFKETMNRCVADRLSAGANGTMLSGGIDSSAVLASSLVVRRDSLPYSVSISFKDPHLAMSQDEHLLKAMFERCDMPHQIIHADSFLRFPSVDDPCPYVNGPDTAANPLAREACARVFQARGISLVMTGEGGDVVLGEAMHEVIVDSIRRNDGLIAVHQYIAGKLGFAPFSLKYLGMLAESVWPAFGRYRLHLRSFKNPELQCPEFFSQQFIDAYRRNSKANLSENCRMKFAYIGHAHMQKMLFPRAAYFDALNVQCTNSHPYLDPRMLAFAFACPPHLQHDYRELDVSNAYASAKMLARRAYRKDLPSFVFSKKTETSYALMARRMFQNSSPEFYQLTERPMLLRERGLIDQECFKRYLMAYIIATTDPNAALGVRYHYLRGILDLETWLIKFSDTKAAVKDRIKIRPLRSFEF